MGKTAFVVAGKARLAWIAGLLIAVTTTLLLGCAHVSYSDPFRGAADIGGSCQSYGVSRYGWYTEVGAKCAKCDQGAQCFYIADIEYQEDGTRFAQYQKAPINQKADLVAWIRKSDRPIAVVVYVHGWHHNASEKSTNRQNFGHLIARYHESIRRLHMANRIPVENTPQVVGVFIGWPGEQYEGFLNIFSIGNRTRVADVVGKPNSDLDNDLRELAREVAAARSKGTKSPMDGAMLVVGHSLGGRVLINTYLPTVKSSGARAADSKGVGLQPLGPRTLVMTMQAAIGADYFAEAMDSPETDSSETKNPHWININSTDDTALGFPYRLGSALGFFPRADSRHRGSGHTLGLFDEYVTHDIAVFHVAECQKGWPSRHPRFACPSKANTMKNAENHPFPWVAGFNASRDGRKEMAMYFPFFDVKKNTLDRDNADLYVLTLQKTTRNPLDGRMWNVRTNKQMVWSTESERSNPQHNGYISSVGIRMAVDAIWNDSVAHPASTPPR